MNIYFAIVDLVSPKSIRFHVFSFTSLMIVCLTSSEIALGCTESLPTINDPDLKAELLYKGFNFPTSFAFLSKEDVLVAEKETGTVQRVVNGQMLDEPVLDVNVATKGERGMLGIAANVNLNSTYVFLYYTEIESEDGADVSRELEPIGNRIYRYELVNGKLVNPKLLLDLPATPGFYHQGGAIMIGPDNNLYLPFGDVSRRTEAQNAQEGGTADGTGGILRISQDGKTVTPGILGGDYPLNLYYAYGIRNSFGIDFDPISGNLWDSENGPNFGDEINLVFPGFNSGFDMIQGIWELNGEDKGNTTGEPGNLVDFGGKGKYRHPELIWDYTVAPTAIKFFNSTNFGNEYLNDLFVGNVNGQPLYRFDLNENRTGLNLTNGPSDRIARAPVDLESYVFAEGFGPTTDIEVGPDGNLYILCHNMHENPSLRNGGLYRIGPGDGGSLNLRPENRHVESNTDSLSTALKVNLEQGNVTNWSVMSTDFIPVKNNSVYNYTLDISASNINQLHSKVLYFDSNRGEINRDFLFEGKVEHLLTNLKMY